MRISMSDLNQSLVELVSLAKKQNPNAESVRVFERLLNYYQIDSESTIKDVECSVEQNVYENSDSPLDIKEIVNCLRTNNFNYAVDKGLSNDTNLNHELTENININFTSQHHLTELTTENELYFRLTIEDLRTLGLSMYVDNSKESINKFVTDLFDDFISNGYCIIKSDITFDTDDCEDSDEETWEFVQISLVGVNILLQDIRNFIRKTLSREI